MQTTAPATVEAKVARKAASKAKVKAAAKSKVDAKKVAKAKTASVKTSKKEIQAALNKVADGMASKFLKNEPVKAKSTRDGAILTLDNGDVVTISVTVKKATA